MKTHINPNKIIVCCGFELRKHHVAVFMVIGLSLYVGGEILHREFVKGGAEFFLIPALDKCLNLLGRIGGE